MADSVLLVDYENMDDDMRHHAFAKLLDGTGERAGWSAFLDEFGRRSRPRSEPETTGEAGEGVWAIYTVDADGGAHVEQVYATELDALRANKHNTDSSRKVRFLPYGIAVSVLDASEESSEEKSEESSGEESS